LPDYLQMFLDASTRLLMDSGVINFMLEKLMELRKNSVQGLGGESPVGHNSHLDKLARLAGAEMPMAAIWLTPENTNGAVERETLRIVKVDSNGLAHSDSAFDIAYRDFGEISSDYGSSKGELVRACFDVAIVGKVMHWEPQIVE